MRRLRVRFGELYTQFRLLTSADVHNDVFMEWSGLARDSLVWQDPAGAAARSLDDFASQAAAWARQCLAFRSSKTWSPTRQSSCFLMFSDLVDLKIEWISSEEWKMG